MLGKLLGLSWSADLYFPGWNTRPNLMCTREGLRRLIIPFSGWLHRMGILDAEEGELLLQGVLSADCIDDIITFQPLTKDQIAKVVELQMNRAKKMLERLRRVHA